MFPVKKRTNTLKKLVKIETIHSFYRQKVNFKSSLTMPLRKSHKQLSPTSQNTFENHSVSLNKLDIPDQLPYSSIFERKKLSFQKLLQNRKILNERGKQINETHSKHRLKMIALEEFKKNKRKENREYFQHNTGGDRIKMGKNIIKTDISCRGLSFQINPTLCEEKNQTLRKIKRLRNECGRMTQPFGQQKRLCTMPDFKQDNDITLCPWEAE